MRQKAACEVKGLLLDVLTDRTASLNSSNRLAIPAVCLLKQRATWRAVVATGLGVNTAPARRETLVGTPWVVKPQTPVRTGVSSRFRPRSFPPKRVV
jgi:hypothetical protein